jgi:hypothetical protein
LRKSFAVEVLDEFISTKGGQPNADENDENAEDDSPLDSTASRSAFADGRAVWAPHPMRSEVRSDAEFSNKST